MSLHFANGSQLHTRGRRSSPKPKLSVSISQFVLDPARAMVTMEGEDEEPVMGLKNVVNGWLIGVILALLGSPAWAQSAPPCRNTGSQACQDAQWGEIDAVFTQGDPSKTARLLVSFLKRPDLAGASNIWRRRGNSADFQNRAITQINLASALSASGGFGEAEALALEILAELGTASPQNDDLRLGALETLASVLAGRKAPIAELVRRREEIVAVLRSQTVLGDDVAIHRLRLARALGNLGDAQMVADTLEPAQASLTETYALMRSISLPDSDPEMVRLGLRWLPLLVARADRCGVEATAARLLPFAEPLGQRELSYLLMQHGENYRFYRSAGRATPLWSRATALEFGMACPATTGTRGDAAASPCTGSPVLIDHLRAVGMSLRYEGQGRAPAGYRSLVQAGDFLRTRTLGGFVLNRDASNAYASSRDIFAEQITTAWAIHDPTAVPKPVEAPWSCAPR
jgi:hypothetical protein